MSVLKAQPRQRISNIYIYLYVSYQSVYTGSEVQRKNNLQDQELMNIVKQACDHMDVSLDLPVLSHAKDDYQPGRTRDFLT